MYLGNIQSTRQLTWEMIPAEIHLGIMAWPSTSLTPGRLATSCWPALNVWRRCSTRDCRSWVVKNCVWSSLPSKQLASVQTNSFNPPPYSWRSDLGKCTSSAAFKSLTKSSKNNKKIITAHSNIINYIIN